MGTVLRNIRPIIGLSRTVNARFEGKAFVEVSEEEIEPQEGDVVLDGRGKLAFSGFVNAHTHLAMVIFRGLADDVPLNVWLEEHIWPLERSLKPEDVYWGTMLALAEAIRGGTTCVADMYFHTDEVGRAVEESGIRALVSYGVIAGSLDGRGRAELDRAVTEAKRWNGAADGRIKGAISPHAVYTCGEDVWREAVNEAERIGVPIHTHLSESLHEVAEWKERTGLSPVAYLERIGAFRVPTIAAHCVHVDEDDMAILAERGVSVAHCPKSNAKLGNGIAPVGRMRNLGVRVAIGTDGAASNNRLDMLEELRMSALLQRARNGDPMRPSAAETLAMATEAGREALGLPTGGLEAGDVADIVLIDAERSHTMPKHDPTATLVYASAAADVTDVIVDGRVLMRNGELLTIDEEKAKAEVTGLLARLKG
ncbi:N-ethylammeline chlorohydrolase [Candidatus Acetothermia bacterium]|nr:MAG: N-ethylammeline chlorohydrolase [Candidatus Acetothermia bacterium]